MNHGATGAPADVGRRRAMPRLQKFDALLLNDLNLILGVFDAALCVKLGPSASIRLRVAVGVRVLLQLVGIGLLIYYGRRHRLNAVGLILVIAAAGLFLSTRHRLKLLLDDNPSLDLGVISQWWVVYVVAYLLPLAGFINLGVLLQLDGSKNMAKVVGWSLQLGIKTLCVVVLILYAMYYKLYAEAWHCYKQETHISEYKYGYCPSYTHQGSFLDPANIICRPDSPIATRPCYGDRHAENLPRNWLAHGRWTYGLLLVPVHMTIAQAVGGINGVYGLL